MVVVTVLFCVVPCALVVEFELVALKLFVDPVKVLVPPLDAAATAVQAGTPAVPIPGRLPGGQVRTVTEPPVVPVEVKPVVVVLLPVFPFEATEETVGVATVVSCALR
jgi:hypothetical protein